MFMSLLIRCRHHTHKQLSLFVIKTCTSIWLVVVTVDGVLIRFSKLCIRSRSHRTFPPFPSFLNLSLFKSPVITTNCPFKDAQKVILQYRLFT